VRQRSAGQLVVLRLGDREYGLVAGAVEQVVRMVAIRPVPEAPPWIAGVVNLRGRTTPMIGPGQEAGRGHGRDHGGGERGLHGQHLLAGAGAGRGPNGRGRAVGQRPEAATLAGGPFAVLYVEDNPSNVKLVEQILHRQPAVRLTVAMRGREGLELARQDPPDLVLLDLHLPDLSGEEVLRELRADPRTAEVPVVVVSADATTGQADRLRGQGAREYLTKPLDVPRLLDVIRATLAS
jgi:CheY-like chemotaxis protein